MANRLSRTYTLGCKLAFTMAEILISLTIIGVIAAITLPSLQANINEKSWATQRKALYSRISHAISMMPSLNGYGVVFEDGSINETETVNKAGLTFLSEGLSKVLKINNICDSENLKKCGIPDVMHNINNTKKIYASDIKTLLGYNSAFSVNYNFQGKTLFIYSPVDIKVTAFETQNSESILLYYNPFCLFPEVGTNGLSYAQNYVYYAQTYMCANFVYDLNGQKGPNKMGKDIGFISAIYPTDPIVVAPMPVSKDAPSLVHEQAIKYCRNADKTTRMPNKEDLMAIFYNRPLLNLFDGYMIYWASNYSGDYATYVNPFIGFMNSAYSRSYKGVVRCIKR